MLPLDHIGIAVLDLDAAITAYARDFGATLDFREELADRGISLAFVRLAQTRVELLAPSSPQSIIQKFIESRGPGLHHLAYTVQDIAAELARFRALGHVLVDESPRPGAEHSQIAFIHPKSMGGVLVELVQPASGAKTGITP